MENRQKLVSAAAVIALSLGSLNVLSCNSDSVSVPANNQPGTAAPSPTATPSSTPSPIVTPSATPSVSPSGNPDYSFQQGTYGGSNFGFTVNPDRTASIKFACAVGNIPTPLTPDEFGAFDTQGTYSPTVGPVPTNGYPVFQARYSGVVYRGDLTLNLSYMDGAGNQVNSTFHGTYGQSMVITELCALSQPSPSPSPAP